MGQEKGQAKRVTCRNMRVTRRGQVTSAAHIDKRNDTPEKRAEVAISKCFDYRGRYLDGDLTAHEADFYERYFRDGLDAQNARYKKKRNYGRIRTMEEYLKGPKTAPEDTLFYIGCKDNEASGEDLLNCYLDFVEWRAKRFPCIKPLGFGLHKEKGAWHIEEHHVWVARDADGNLVSDQGKALEQMGVQRPDLTAKVGRHNNAKMSYTAECREKWIEIAKARGYEIIEVPRERGRSGQSLDAYITQQMKEQREAELVDVTRSIVNAQRELGDLTEFKAWRAARDAEAAKEAARKQEAEEKAKAAAEAARKAQEAQEQARREQEAKRAALAAQEAARPKTPEERYQEARAAIFGGTAPQAAPEHPKRVAGPSAMDRLKQATQAAARETGQNGLDGPDF
jgi:hypothetical protein